MPFSKVPFGDIDNFNVVIEVPAGSQKKYAYNKDIGAMRLERVISGETVFPFSYGHVPQTFSGDNDFLDAFVISNLDLAIGTVVACRPVGVLEVVDRGRRDNKILAVPNIEPTMNHVVDIHDVPEEHIKKLKDFINALPVLWGHEITLFEVHGKKRAEKELQAAHEFED
jgi:inorganic pyrophosphatase